MSITDARWINKDGQSFDQTVLNELTIKLKAGGGIGKDADGLHINIDLLDFRGVIDPVADGGVSALPTAAGADTTVQNGTVLGAGEYYIVASNGLVGGLSVSSGDLVMVNGTTLPPTADAHFNVVSATGPAGTVASTRTINSGNGLSGGGDLTADRTLAVAPDTTTGGDVKPVVVGPNGVGFDQSVITADQLTLSFVPSGVTPDAAGAIAAGAPAGTVASDLSAILEGMNDKIDTAGPKVETFTLSGAAPYSMTLAAAPTAPTEVIVDVAGAPTQVITNDYTVATNVVSFTAGPNALLAAGDVVRVTYR